MTKETRLDGGRPVLPDEMMPPGVAPPRDRSPSIARHDGTDFRPIARIAAEMALRIGWKRSQRAKTERNETDE